MRAQRQLKASEATKMASMAAGKASEPAERTSGQLEGAQSQLGGPRSQLGGPQIKASQRILDGGILVNSKSHKEVPNTDSELTVLWILCSRFSPKRLR